MSESPLTPTLTRPGGVSSTAPSGLFEYEALARTRLLAAVSGERAGGADDGVTVHANHSRRHAPRRIACSRS
ncbi:MAG TPA: hypothetical protein VF192_14065 [Longimicrobiales bacterium]